MKIRNTAVKLSAEAISSKTLRLCVLPENETAVSVFSTIDLAQRPWTEPGTVMAGDGTYQVGPFAVEVEGQRVTVSVQGRRLQCLTIGQDDGKIVFPLGNSHIYGLGHGFDRHFDRRGKYYDLRTNGQVKPTVWDYSATSPSPYVISTDGWALFFHQPWKSNIDLTGSDGVFSAQPEYPCEYADIFVVCCSEPADAAKEYYRLTGLPPMPPKYAFGYQQSYRTLEYKGENEVLKTARYMRDHDLPCDMLIYLGSGYCENGWNTNHGNFDWNPVSFPKPREMMQELHDMHYKVSIHVLRCFTGLHGNFGDENVSPLEYDHIQNYWKLHEKVYDSAKNEAWWPDSDDAIDMEQRLTRHRMYYEGSLRLNPNLRPFHMQRNAFPGFTKWGGVIWSGDVKGQWSTFRNQIPIGLNAGLSCTPFWGTDTGGFFSTIEYTGELFVRWFEYSAFTPFFRGHGRPSFLHTPWGWKIHHSLDEMPLESAPQTPGDNPPPADSLPDERVEPICRKYIHERYALMPYLYTLSYEVHDAGLPMMRPLWFYYPDDETASGLGSEYMLGQSLLVAPVTEQGAENWRVYLPEGVWFDYWTNEAYAGGKWIDAEAKLDTIPLFVKAGSILPIGPDVQYIDTAAKSDFDPLSLRVYPGADGRYRLYEDDGVSLNYLNGESSVTEFIWDDASKTLSAECGSAVFPGKTRRVPYTVVGTDISGAIELRY